MCGSAFSVLPQNRPPCKGYFKSMEVYSGWSHLYIPWLQRIYSLNFTFMWPWIVTNFFIIKPTKCTDFTNLFWHETVHVSCQNKFVKLVHLVGFIIKKYSLKFVNGAESSSRSQQVFSKSWNSPHFMEPESSSPHSQVPATCSYPKPARSSPYPHIPLPEDPLKFISNDNFGPNISG